MAEQSLTPKTPDSTPSPIKAAARALVSKKALLGWAVVAVGWSKTIYSTLNFVSVIEFAAQLRGNPHVRTILDLLQSNYAPPIMTVLGFIWLGYLVLRPQKPKDQSLEPDAGEQPAKPPPVPEKPKLDFVIDTGQESHVNVQRGGGRANATRVIADIRLRCEKETDSPMAVRSFRLSIHRLEADGTVTTVPYQEEAQVAWEDSKGKLISSKDGWEIDKPRSDYRHYAFTLEITPQVQDALSPDHFFQLTMDAIGQDAITKTVYVKDWTEGEYSPISLKPFPPYPLEAQKEIKQLKAELESYKQTNAALGKKNQEYDWLIQLAKDQKAAIHEHVVLQDFTFCYMEQLTPSIFKVVFALVVTNNSVLDISVSDELDGTIRFEGVELLDKKRVISPVKDAPHGATRSLTIEQRLSKGEADTIRDAKLKTGQANFEFDDLIVNIVGGSRSPEITSRKLKIPKNTTASAFPITQAIRSARVKALSYVWGRCVQLQEPLRIDDNPIAKSTIENWESGARTILEREGYTKDEAKKIMQQVIPAEGDFSETSAPSQRQWIHYCIAVLEDLIAKEIKAIHVTAEPRRLTEKEILQRIEELPVEDQARAYQAFGALLEGRRQLISPNNN